MYPKKIAFKYFGRILSIPLLGSRLGHKTLNGMQVVLFRLRNARLHIQTDLNGLLYL